MNFDGAVGILDYHRSMLGDAIRTGGLKEAIDEVIRPGDVVVDLGTGTGVLSYFACLAGAARVYAIEEGPVADLAEEICAENGLADRVTFLRGRSYDVEVPEPADVLITETLWNAGIGEGMLGYVVDARRRFLRPGARILPETVDVMVAPVEYAGLDEEVDRWPEDCFGVDLSPVRRYSRHNLYRAKFQADMLLAAPEPALEVDLQTVATTDVAGTARLAVARDGTVHGLGLWFRSRLSPSVMLTNGPPRATPSWAHTFLPLEEPVDLKRGQVLRASLQTTANGTVWRWRARVADGEGHELAAFDQSTFWGWPFAPRTHAKRASSARPSRSPLGEAHRFVLDRFDGTSTLEAVEQDLVVAFPTLFVQRRDASVFVRDLAEAYG